MLWSSQERQLKSDSSSNSATKLPKGQRLPLKNYGNVQYIGKVAFGNPRQYLAVVFDTGSSDTWIPSTDCLSCGSHMQFEASSSTTFLDTQEKFYDAVTELMGLSAVSIMVSRLSAL